MKSLHNFLVNNHVNKVDPNETKEIKESDIVQNMCIAEEYEIDGKLNTSLCVADQVFRDRITTFIQVYLHENKPGDTHDVYIDDAIYKMHTHKKYRTTTATETDLLNTIMKKAYDEFKGNGNIVIGKVKDMKFRKRNRL